MIRCAWSSILAMTLLQLAVPAWSQWSVPGPIQMGGALSDERQVIGLGPAELEADALNLDGVRRQLANSGSVVPTGTTWEISVGTEGAPPIEGSVLFFIAPEPTPAGLSLDVNGSGPLLVTGWEGLPLENGAFAAGASIRAVRTTDRYQVLQNVRTTCPPGYIAYGPGACIAANWRGPATYFAAADSCLMTGARLCTFAEWTSACSLIANFMDQVSQPEWIDHAANSTNYAKVIGVGENGYSGAGTGCDYGGIRLPTNNARFRCCIER